MLEHHFEKLSYFYTVAEKGGFAAAARHLRISQSSLSMSVKIIEDELGTQLFERSRKGVSLTSAGTRLIEVYRTMRTTIRDLEVDIKNFNSESARALVVGTHDAVATGLWPELVRGVSNIPGLSLILNTNASASGLMQSLRDRAYDCIIVAEPVESNDWDILNIGSVHYRLYGPTDSPDIVNRKTLLEQGVIAHKKALAGNKILLGQRLETLSIPTNAKLQVDSIETVREMVSEGLGYGILPSELTRRYERRGFIKKIETSDIDQNELGVFELALCVPKGRSKDFYFLSLLSVIRSTFSVES